MKTHKCICSHKIQIIFSNYYHCNICYSFIRVNESNTNFIEKMGIRYNDFTIYYNYLKYCSDGKITIVNDKFKSYDEYDIYISNLLSDLNEIFETIIKIVDNIIFD